MPPKEGLEGWTGIVDGVLTKCTGYSQVPRVPAQDDAVQPDTRRPLPLPCTVAHLLQGRPRHDPAQDVTGRRGLGAVEGVRGRPAPVRQG